MSNNFKTYDSYKKNFSMMKSSKSDNAAFESCASGARLGNLNLVKAYIDVFGVNKLEDKDAMFGMTLFSNAAHFGYREVAKYLLSKGANINAMDDAGNTALIIWAVRAQAGHPNYRDFLLFLLDEGADPTIQSKLGQTAAQFLSSDPFLMGYLENVDARRRARLSLRRAIFMHMCENNQIQRIKNYIQRNPEDVLHPGNDGQTCLFYALRGKAYQTAELLIQHGADVNAVMNDGNSLLMNAVIKHDVRTVQLLLDNNADIYLKGKHGVTAYGILRQEMTLANHVEYTVLHQMKKLFDQRRKADFSKQAQDSFKRGTTKEVPKKQAKFKRKPKSRGKRPKS